MGTAEKKDDKVDGNSENAEAKKGWKAPMITLDDDEPAPDEGEGKGDDEGEGDDNAEAADGSESQDDDTHEGDGQQGDGDDDDQQQIVREGDDTQSQATTPRGFLKRINKLNGKVGEAKEGEATQKDRADFLEQENQVQKSRIQQLEGGAPPPQPLERPDVNTFDGGVYDPAYTKAVDEYNDKRQDARFNDRLAEHTKKSTVTNSQAELAQKLRTKQEAHISRATKLKVKDYEATEDIAISIMGNEKVNHIILALPDRTEQLIYYLGKNPKLAQKYSDMLETETVRALMELGGVLSEIKVKTVSKKSLKDPDEDLEGGNLPTDKKKRGPKGATFA
jgi:hypothetical protein